MKLVAPTGRTEAGWEAQKQREQAASAKQRAARAVQRAAEQTAAPEHASLNPAQGATVLAMIFALRSLDAEAPVPKPMYGALALVRLKPI